MRDVPIHAMWKRPIAFVVDRTIATKLLACFGLLIAVGLCGGWLTYGSLLNIEASDRSATHSHEVLSTTRTVWIGILKQESDVRAYLLTGDRGFLDKAQASDKALKATLARKLAARVGIPSVSLWSRPSAKIFPPRSPPPLPGPGGRAGW